MFNIFLLFYKCMPVDCNKTIASLNFIPHNLIYMKRIYYKDNFTTELNTLACIYDTLYKNLIFHQLMHLHYNIFFPRILPK